MQPVRVALFAPGGKERVMTKAINQRGEVVQEGVQAFLLKRRPV